MSRNEPLSAETKAGGHQLYQALYARVSEGVEVPTAQTQAEIDCLASPDTSADRLIRAATAEANYRYYEACDDDSALTVDDYIPEPSGRMMANVDVVGLLEDAQAERWDAEAARCDAQIAQWDVEIAQWEAEDALRGIS
jgi:hypothetical protein